jgi:alkylation response protein AidB-like acyl-CoA dehydrogenase
MSATNLELTNDQEIFQQTTVRFIESDCSLQKVRTLIEDTIGVEPGYVSQVAELGWYALFVPEALGGGSISGRPLLDAIIVAEERGRYLQPGPFVGHNVVAAAIAELGTSEQQSILPSLASGSSLASWAISDQRGNCKPELGVRATSNGSAYVLSGERWLVDNAKLADTFLVSAAHDGGVTQFLVPADTAGVSVEELESLDLTRRCGRVTFSEVTLDASAILGEAGDAEGAVQRQLDLAIALHLGETVGAIDQLLEMTRQYAISRIAFGRPIGSFQALKHLIANLSLFAEMSKAAVLAAANAIELNRPDASEVASIAKAFVGERGIEIAQGCLQVHGGIGFTWEHDLHLYLRRISANTYLYGSPEWHRERICAIHEL